jgi:hypothetical protein
MVDGADVRHGGDTTGDADAPRADAGHGAHPGDGAGRVRLRQAVFVAERIEPLASELREELGLGEPFRDPGVGMFGLENVVFAIGDTFLEVIAPTQPDTAAGRYLAARGPGGYMALFDLEDLTSARERAQRVGVRVVWQLDLPDISGTHLHPADMRGAIVSLDCSRPYGSWRWGGPAWTGRTSTGAPGMLRAITVAVAEPAQVAARWSRVLAAPLSEGTEPTLQLDGGTTSFTVAGAPEQEGIVEFALELPPEARRGREAIELGGVRLRLLAAPG